MIATRMGNGQYSLLVCSLERLGILEVTEGVRKTPALPQGIWDVGEKTTTSSKGFQGVVTWGEPSFYENKRKLQEVDDLGFC